MNGVSLASNYGAVFGINGSLITLNGSSTIHSIVHGQSLSSSVLLNYNNLDYLNIVRNCYSDDDGGSYYGGYSGGGGCFLPGTKVMTINGYKDIDKIRVGIMFFLITKN